MAKRIMPFDQNAVRGPQWKAIMRSALPLEFLLFGTWHEKTRIYRWRWLATLAARWHASRQRSGVLTSAAVEPYWPGGNVIPLRRFL